MAEEETDNKNYVVKVPWHVSVLHDPDERFPDLVGGQEVEMTGEQRKVAKAAAKEAHVKLVSKEVS